MLSVASPFVRAYEIEESYLWKRLWQLVSSVFQGKNLEGAVFFLSFLLFEFVVSAKWGYLRPSCRGVPGVDKLPSLWFRDTGHHWRLQLPGSNLEGLFFGLKNNSRSHFARYRQREEEGIGPCEQQRMNMFSNGRMRRGFK